MPKTVSELKRDEHKAVREYGEKARVSRPPVAKKLRHIQGEEKHHAKELDQLKKNSGFYGE